ncbi:MAG: hypothetical protein GY866_25535 [Proteobacteria bacterium]|nr:hypothetical protein [Pseudomonadota bacterium]
MSETETVEVVGPASGDNSCADGFKRLVLQALLLVFVGLLPYHGYGEEVVLDDQETFRFASYLYRNGEYYRAVSEYKRLIYFFPDSPLADEAVLQIGRSYMAGDRIDEAIGFWKSELKTFDSENDVFYRIKTLLGISLLDMDRAKPFPLRTENIEAAVGHLSEIGDRTPEAPLVEHFLDDWKRRPDPEYKSPWLAGSMSAVVPGSGSFYSGRYREGLYAFFITSLFYLATLEATHRDEEELALVFGFFTLTFYGGSIYTAVNGVYKSNDEMEADTLFDLRKKHGIWFVPETNRRKGRF